MNQISYDQWQAMIRLPYLAVLAFWIGQRMHLHGGQIKAVLAHLALVKDRNLDNVVGQVADDSGAELLNHLKALKGEDVSHFKLQCARVLAAAENAMSHQEFHQYVCHHREMLHAMYGAVPWHARFLEKLRRPVPIDPRAMLQEALGSAAPGVPKEA